MAAVSNDERTLANVPIQVAAYAGYTVHDPLDAWAGAGSEVKVSYLVVGNTLYQLGHNVGDTGNLWERSRDFLNGGPFTEWAKLGTDGIGGGLVGGYAKVTDGSAQLALPDWQKLEFTSAVGDVVELQGTDLLIKGAGAAGVEVRGEFLHSWDSWLVFGVSKNGGAIQEFARTQIVSVDPVFVVADYRAALVAGDVVALYVSSNFEWAEFTWSNVQALCLSPAT